MSVAIRQLPSGRGSIRAALPWVGMGLCLAAFLSYLAYDRLLGKPPGRRLEGIRYRHRRHKTTPASRPSLPQANGPS